MPETWLDGSCCWRDLLSSRVFRTNLKCIVVDECHKISWGTASGKAFCEAFSRIKNIRSFCSESVPVLALSATVDNDYTELVPASCGLSSQSLKIVHLCSDRVNIRLSTVKLKSKDDICCFNWILEMLIKSGVECPKILIYCRTQTLVGWLFEKFLLRLKNLKYLMAMYHANTLDHNKQKVMDSRYWKYTIGYCD